MLNTKRNAGPEVLGFLNNDGGVSHHAREEGELGKDRTITNVHWTVTTEKGEAGAMCSGERTTPQNTEQSTEHHRTIAETGYTKGRVVTAKRIQ